MDALLVAAVLVPGLLWGGWLLSEGGPSTLFGSAYLAFLMAGGFDADYPPLPCPALGEIPVGILAPARHRRARLQATRCHTPFQRPTDTSGVRSGGLLQYAVGRCGGGASDFGAADTVWPIPRLTFGSLGKYGHPPAGGRLPDPGC